MNLGQRLRQARLEAGLSQRQLCGDVITRNMLSQIENGSARPSMDTLQYLAVQLGRPVSYFLDGTAAVSPNQARIAQARDAYARGNCGDALALLEDYSAPDPVFDNENGLLTVLSLLALAQQAIEENRLPYAQQLIARAEVAGKSCCYVTDDLKRKLLLLSAAAQPSLAESVVAQLNDGELLLRAQSALDRKDFARCAALLDAANDQSSSRWHNLRGEAAFGLGNFEEAVAHFKQIETDMPQIAAPRLEQCYLQLEDYKMAYFYANLQRR